MSLTLIVDLTVRTWVQLETIRGSAPDNPTNERAQRDVGAHCSNKDVFTIE